VFTIVDAKRIRRGCIKRPAVVAAARSWLTPNCDRWNAGMGRSDGVSRRSSLLCTTPAVICETRCAREYPKVSVVRRIISATRWHSVTFDVASEIACGITEPMRRAS
jgi:hypothetical protein